MASKTPHLLVVLLQLLAVDSLVVQVSARNCHLKTGERFAVRCLSLVQCWKVRFFFVYTHKIIDLSLIDFPLHMFLASYSTHSVRASSISWSLWADRCCSCFWAARSRSVGFWWRWLWNDDHCARDGLVWTAAGPGSTGYFWWWYVPIEKRIKNDRTKYAMLCD